MNVIIWLKYRHFLAPDEEEEEGVAAVMFWHIHSIPPATPSPVTALLGLHSHMHAEEPRFRVL